jgi:hypothetical protein
VKRRPAWGWIAALLLGFAGVWQLQKGIDVDRALIAEEDGLLLRSPKLVKFLSLEFSPLMADLYWTRAVQYYGDKHLHHDSKLDLLWPLLDIATTLDPHLVPAYRFGAVFLSDSPPRGAGQPERAVELIERGIASNPEYWRFYQDLGNVYYFDLHDYHKSAQAFLKGSRFPETPIWMKVMAAKIAGEGQSLETSQFLWTEIYQSSRDENVRDNAQTHLKLIRAQQDCEAIDEISREFQRRTGRRPAALRELLQAGLLPGTPVDPDGHAYVLGEDGSAQLDPQSPLSEKQGMFERLSRWR